MSTSTSTAPSILFSVVLYGRTRNEYQWPVLHFLLADLPLGEVDHRGPPPSPKDPAIAVPQKRGDQRLRRSAGRPEQQGGKRRRCSLAARWWMSTSTFSTQANRVLGFSVPRKRGHGNPCDRPEKFAHGPSAVVRDLVEIGDPAARLHDRCVTAYFALVQRESRSRVHQESLRSEGAEEPAAGGEARTGHVPCILCRA